MEFNERPCIVPPEIQDGLNVPHRALSPKYNFLSLHSDIQNQTTPSFSSMSMQ
jgi:hypothetical protein